MHAIISPESLLKKGFAELSLPCRREQTEAFMTYLAELKKWNRAYNLTSLRTDEDIVIKHFLDSLLYLKPLPEGEISVMDVGSGAGFPGIPMKIVRPEIEMHLIEPSRKKANFLLHIIKTLGFQKIEVIEGRIEEIKSLTVDAAVTRALFDIRDFYKKTAHKVKEGGMLVLSKGPKVKEELEKTGSLNYDLLTLNLPMSNIKRFIVIIRKGASTKDSASGHFSVSTNNPLPKSPCICANIECRLRKAGCMGFEGCPGFKARA